MTMLEEGLRAEIERRYQSMIAADWEPSERVEAIKETLRELRDFGNSMTTTDTKGLRELLERVLDDQHASGYTHPDTLDAIEAALAARQE